MDKITQILENVVRCKYFEAGVHIKNPIRNSYQDGLGWTTETLDHVVVVHILLWDKRKSQINENIVIFPMNNGKAKWTNKQTNKQRKSSLFQIGDGNHALRTMICMLPQNFKTSQAPKSPHDLTFASGGPQQPQPPPWNKFEGLLVFHRQG